MRTSIPTAGPAFIGLCAELDVYLNELAAGENRAQYVPLNKLDFIHDAFGRSTAKCPSVARHSSASMRIRRKSSANS